MAALQRADDAHRYSLSDPERVADSQHDVADMRLVRLSEGNRRKVVADIHLDHGEIRVRVGAHDMALGGAAVSECDFDLVGGLHHVMVGQDVAVMADDDPGAQAGALLRDVVIEFVAEEETETRVVHEWRGRRLHLAAGKDIYHRRHDLLCRTAETHGGQISPSPVALS